MATIAVIDIRPSDLEIIRAILRRHVSDCEVWAFGSRVHWASRDHSDIDLAIRCSSPVSPITLSALRDDFAESNLPMRVDVLDMASVDEKFRKLIEEEYAVVHLRDEVTLSEVAKITMGQSPPGSTYNTDGIGLPFYQGVADFQERYPKKRVFCVAPTRFAEQGDILLSVRAPIGRVNLAIERCAIGRGLASIRAIDFEDQTFLEFALRQESDNWRILESQGSVFGNAKKSDLVKLSIPWPSRERRRSIARILGALDDKIAANRKMNATLESISQALFQSWFVNFDPVHANSKGHDSGLPLQISNLFPDEFENSELGKIPKGWKVVSLGDVAKIVKGRSYKSVELSESSTALVTLKSFQRGGGYRADGLKPYIGEFKPEQKIEAGELIIAYTDVTQMGEVIGRPAIVMPTDEFSTLIASLDVGIVRPTTRDLAIPYLYCMFLTDSFQNHVRGYSTGTTVLHLNTKGLPSYKFACPPAELRRHYNRASEALLDGISANHEKSHSLGKIRDNLMSRLLSGELRVKV